MVQASDLDLPYLDILGEAFRANPEKYLNDARQHGWLARSSMGYVVLDFRGMRDLLKMDDQLRSPNRDVSRFVNAENSPWGRWNAEFIQGTSGETHTRLRRLVNHAFTPQKARLHRPVMREVMTDLLDKWAPLGRFDFAEFASYYPITVLLRLIGAPTRDVDRMRAWLEPLSAGFALDESRVPALDEGVSRMFEYLEALVAERRQHPPVNVDKDGDLLDWLIHANEDGDQLSDRELFDMLMILFGAGYDTSKNQLTVLMHHMLDRPAEWQRMATDQEFARQVLDEMLRYKNVLTTFRLPNADFTYRDVVFPKDTWLILPVAFAGRDPSYFDDPESFDPTRENKRTLAFGMGAHMCLGKFVALAQLEEALPLIASRIKNPRLDGEAPWRPFLGVWGLTTLPIAFDPA